LEVSFAYYGRSRLDGGLLSFAPNLAREAVAFDAPLLGRLRFREGIWALHDGVISDLRFKPRDKTAYDEWKKGEVVGDVNCASSFTSRPKPRSWPSAA